MDDTTFVYVTYIRTTPEKLWQALTTREFLAQYWSGGPARVEPQPGSPVKWEIGGEVRDLGQVVLESEPYRRLSYSWHNYQKEYAKMFGWTDEQFAELVKEKRSKVTFDLEPAGSAVKLTVIHDDFVPGSEMLKGVSQGWPQILSSLKSLLETGQPLTWAGVS
jgi:uncharacterized protein YndB with AHSA1/START domain